MENLNFYILTGGPGSGKSTVLNVLSGMGFSTVREAGRDIIRDQETTGGDAVPWKNTSRYARLMLLRSITDFKGSMHCNKPCFFDRGIADTLGYCRLIGIPVSKELENAVKSYRYNTKVFIFPPWKEIYINDKERKQDFREAEDTYLAIREGYEEYGYRTITVPYLSPHERAEWILSKI